MAKNFSANERRILSLFANGLVFNYKGDDYTVNYATKPTCGKGEPKTDIFISTIKNTNNQEVCFKISYKQNNADFLENKTNAERAELLLGKDWAKLIQKSTENIKGKFESRYLIYKSKHGKTEAGAITLGWKFELLRVLSGELSGEMILTHEQKVDVYAGTNLPKDKRDALVNGTPISNSGIAEYMFEETTSVSTAQDVIDAMLTIEEFLVKYPKIYFACKALNYRSFVKKFDGDRPLSVYVDWNVVNDKLNPELKYNAPLTTKGNSVCKKLLKSLEELGIKDANGVVLTNIVDMSKVHE